MPATLTDRAVAMPAAFFRWQLDERQDMFERLLAGEHPRFWAAHLPVVSTTNHGEAAFPIHSSTKGVGLLPRPEFMDEHLAEIEACLDRCAGRRPATTRTDRIETARSLYEHPERIDDGRFGSIEIFGGRTYRNLKADPRATLLFTSPGPRYLSYQLNCLAQIVNPAERAFRFILGMRFLFEMERFHIRQPAYPLGYVFRIREAYDKSPRPGRAGRRE